MATTNLGKVCVTPKGAWASGTAYEVLDIVTNAGGSYLAKQNVPAGTALSNTTYWLQIASKGDKGDTATVAVGSTTTGAEGTNASVTNSGTSTDGVFNFTIPRGNTGNGIQSITKTGSTGVVDHYRILFTDNDYFDYDVTNASSGVWGSITGTLEDQTDLQAELDNKADAITVTASGDIVSISDGGDNLPVKALSVAVEAVQDLHGYDAPWPAGAKPNIVYKMIANASIDASGLIVPDTGFNLFIAKVESGQTYTFSNDGVATNSSDTGYFSSDPVMGSVTYDGSRDLTVPATFTASYTGYIGLRLVASKTKGQLELGSTATTYAPYSNICPITGWTGANVTRCGKNVFDHSEVTILSSSLSDTNGTFSNLVTDTRTNLQLSIIAMNENTAVNTVSSFVVASTGVVSRTLTITHPCTSIRVKHNGLTRDIGIQYPWTLQGSVTISVNVQGYDPTTVGGLVLKDIQFELGDSATPYVSYSGTTLPISFGSGNTVYGGTLDVKAGTLTVTHKSETITSFSALYNYAHEDYIGGQIYKSDLKPNSRINGLANYLESVTTPGGLKKCCVCFGANDQYIYAVIQKSMVSSEDLTGLNAYFTANPLQVVYPLETPTTITLSGSTLSTLLGDNTLWADCGSVDIEYRADTKLYTDKAISESALAVKKIITTTTTQMVAPRNLVSGDIVIVNDDLYKATSNIASGSALTVGTNVAKITLAEWVASLVA